MEAQMHHYFNPNRAHRIHFNIHRHYLRINHQIQKYSLKNNNQGVLVIDSQIAISNKFPKNFDFFDGVTD